MANREERMLVEEQKDGQIRSLSNEIILLGDRIRKQGERMERLEARVEALAKDSINVVGITTQGGRQ